MSERRSYWKLLAVSAMVGGAALLAGSWLSSRQSTLVDALEIGAWVFTVVAVLVALSAVTVLLRDRHQRHERDNLFQVLNRARSETRLALGPFDFGLAVRRAMRTLTLRSTFIVGETVEIRSYDEIMRTLDANGCIDGLPFIPEMRRFCGQRARVFRRVDKIYDYGRTKTLLRLDDTYSLLYLRCDGSAHGGCQAGCSLLWKQAWLKPVRGAQRLRAITPSNDEVTRPETSSENGQKVYVCQFTQLAAASTKMSDWDPRQDLRPLFAGNLTVRAFAVALMTRLFNYVQRLRRGVGYPAIPEVGSSTPIESQRLEAGDVVRVREPAEIAATLTKGSRNKGLWFDPDMLKYCGHRCIVDRRVERIVDDATGLMREMKTPCIVLRGIDYSGETLRFAAQEEPLYWREAWLVKETSQPGASVKHSDA